MSQLLKPFDRTLRFFLLCFLTAATAVSAQAQTAALSGVVSDEITGSFLPGASIRIDELGIETRSDRAGNFSLRNVPAGTYTIQVTYISYSPVTRTISIAPGERAILDVMMRSVFAELDAFVVEGSIRDGQVRALNQQRTSANLINVVSSDAIGRFPDPNIAEALQRVPGIAITRDQGEGRAINIRGAPSEFSPITINGISLPSTESDSRAIDLDILPTDIVSSLEVTKAIRPDQSADAISGAVNIVTPSPFDFGRRNILGSFSYTYNDLSKNPEWRASAAVSDVLMDGKFGYSFGVSYNKTLRQPDNLENSWAVDNEGRFFVEDVVLKDYETRRDRRSVIGSLDFRPFETDTYFFVRGTFARFQDNELRNRLNVDFDAGTYTEIVDGVSASADRILLERGFRWRIYNNKIWSLSAGGVHEFDRSTLDYTISLAEAEQFNPRRQDLLFRLRTRPSATYDFSRSFDFPDVSVFQTNEHLNVDDYNFRQIANRTNENKEKEITFSTNYEISHDLFELPFVSKVGFHLRAKDKAADEFRSRSRAAGDGPPGGFASIVQPGNIASNFGYVMGPKVSPEVFAELFDPIFPRLPIRVEQSIVSDYEADEKIYAGYFMTQFERGNADVLLGFRVEHTSVKGDAFRFNEDTNTAIPVSSSSSYTDIFPGLHLRYSFNPNLIARAAITTGISRPDFASLVPTVSVSDEDRALSRGNPDLSPTKALNFDLGIEYYLEPLGFLGVNIFYKDIEDFYFTATSTVSGGEFNGFRQSRPENAKSGYIAGIELAAQQTFTFLPAPFDGLGIYANATFTDSEIELPLSGEKVLLPGQSERNGNLSLFYERSGFNARISYVARSRYIDSISVGGGRAFDTYWDGRSQLDFTSSYQLTRSVQLFFEGVNLTDTRGVRFDGVRERVQEIEGFGRWYIFGARINL